MKITPTALPGRFERLIVNYSFLLLFPGFFFYHTLLGLGLMGAFLGGYFAPVELLFLMPLLFIYGLRIKRDPQWLTTLDTVWWLFLLYFAAVVIVNAAGGANRAIVNKHLLEITFLITLFLQFKFIDFAGSEFRIPALGSLIAMTAIICIYAVDGVFYLGAQDIAQDAESLATYQGFSRSYLFTFMAVVPYTRALPIRLVLYAMAAVALFLNTARSEFAAVLFIIPIIEFYHSRHKMYFILVTVVIGALLHMNMQQLVAALPENRILELLDLSKSTSANIRHYLSLHAMQTIAAHPILGDYASYSPGYYSHNILSAYVDLGLLGFIYVLGMLIIPAIAMFFKEYFAPKLCPDFLLGFALACATVLLLISSHYFTDMLIGATLGAYSKYRYGKKHAKYRPSHFGPSAPRHPNFRQAVPQPGAARP